MRYVLLIGIILITTTTIAFYKCRKIGKKLKGRNEELELLANNVPGGVIRYNYFSGEFDFISQGFLDLLGYSSEDIINKYNNNFYNIVNDNNEKKVTTSENIETEYEVTTSDNSVIWVLNRGRLIITNGKYFIYSIVIDITESKLTQEKLILNDERNRIILNKSDSVIFEWDIISDKLKVSEDWEKKFGYSPNVDSFIRKVVNYKIIHNRDINKFIELFQGVVNGECFGEDVVRIKGKQNKYIWCKVRLTTTFDDKLSPIGAVGVVIDIDRDRRKTEEFKKQAQRDMLTGVYNKKTAECLIKSFLEGNGKGRKHALFIIDIDDFKGINDNYGHLKGDKVLSEISSKIKGEFRKNDIVGRMGGDEFIVLLKDIRSIDVVKKKAETLTKVFKQENHGLKVSGSIGVAIYKEDGEIFKNLYENADKALYSAKRHGKDCYNIYSNEFNKVKVG